MFLCCGDEVLVLGHGFYRRFGDEHVDLAFDGVERYRVVCCVWGKDRYGGARGKGVDGGLVGFGVPDGFAG